MMRTRLPPCPYRLSTIKYKDRVYHLRQPFVVMVGPFVDDWWLASHEDTPVSGAGTNAEEALADFACMFDAQYRDLVECPEEKLAASGLSSRRKLERLTLRVDVRDSSPTGTRGTERTRHPLP